MIQSASLSSRSSWVSLMAQYAGCLSWLRGVLQHVQYVISLALEYVYISMLHVDFSSHHGFLFSHRNKQVTENFHSTCLHYLHPVWFCCCIQSKQNQSLLSKRSANRYLFFGPLIFFDQVCRLSIIVSQGPNPLVSPLG